MWSPPFAEAFTLITETVTGQDGDGNDVKVASEVPVRGTFAPEGSTELIQGQNTVISNDTAYLNPGEPVPAPTDQLRRELTGAVYQIDGQPQVFYNSLVGDKPGAVCRLERVTG